MTGPEADCPIDPSAGDVVAQAVAALLQLRLSETSSICDRRQGRTMPSSFELAQLVGDFVRIPNKDARRRCLAFLRMNAAASTGPHIRHRDPGSPATPPTSSHGEVITLGRAASYDGAIVGLTKP